MPYHLTCTACLSVTPPCLPSFRCRHRYIYTSVRLVAHPAAAAGSCCYVQPDAAAKPLLLLLLLLRALLWLTHSAAAAAAVGGKPWSPAGGWEAAWVLGAHAGTELQGSGPVPCCCAVLYHAVPPACPVLPGYLLCCSMPCCATYLPAVLLPHHAAHLVTSHHSHCTVHHGHCTVYITTVLSPLYCHHCTVTTVPHHNTSCHLPPLYQPNT